MERIIILIQHVGNNKEVSTGWKPNDPAGLGIQE